ncbi:hypothetical protein WJX79_001304 [Trebouxia sp. C0005]
MSAVVQDFRLESQLHKDGFAVWPAENTKVFTALAQAFTEFCAVTATELQQLVLVKPAATHTASYAGDLASSLLAATSTPTKWSDPPLGLACDGSLNTLGEQKAGEDLHRLAKNFRDAWKVQASRVPHFFYAMFSISWRVLAVSGQAAGNVALCQILNQGRLYLQYPEHFGNPACIPGWLMLYTVPNQADVDYVPTSAGPPASGEPGGKHMLTTCFASSASIGNSVGWQVLQTRAHSTASLVSQPLLAQALYLGPYHQLTILDESVGLLLSNVKWDGLRILSAQYPLRVGRSITRMRSTVLTDTFNKCIRQAIPHMVRAFSSEGGQNQPIFHYTSDIVMNLVPENDWYVDFPDGIRLVNNTKFRAFSASFRTRDWGGDKLVLMVDIFQEKRFYEKRHQWRMEWDNQCKFLCLLQLQHRRIVIRMWLVGKNEAGIVSASWNKGVLAMADHAGFGEIIPWKQAIEALLREAWEEGKQKETSAMATETASNGIQEATNTPEIARTAIQHNRNSRSTIR